MTDRTNVAFDGPHGLLLGTVHRDPTKGARQPSVIVAGSWLTVKEQMATTYATALAARGITAMTFDYSGFGESEGTPRQLEMPVRKMGDLAAAAAFLRTQSLVEGGRIGALAICASAQYALGAVAAGARIDAVASVAGWFHDTTALAAFYGGDEGIAKRLKASSAAVERYTRTREVVMAPAYAPGDERAGMFFELPYYGQAERGAVPAWVNEMAVMSWAHWLGFDGVRAGESAVVPTLFVHSDGCVFPEKVKALHEARGDRSELVWLEGTQTDFYDLPAYVAPAVAAADAFFRRTLTRTSDVR
jgi:hypothetical protein